MGRRRRKSKVGNRARLRVSTPEVRLSVPCHLCCGEERVGRVLQKEVHPPDKAVRRAICQLKRDLDFVGGLHSGWQRLEKEDQILGRLVLLLFCIRNITSLKVRVERTEFEFLFPLSAARENTPSTSRVPSIFEIGPTEVQYVQPRRNKICICWVYSCMYSSKLPHYRI